MTLPTRHMIHMDHQSRRINKQINTLHKRQETHHQIKYYAQKIKNDKNIPLHA